MLEIKQFLQEAEAIYHQGGSHHPKVVWNEAVMPLGTAVPAGCAANWLNE